MNSAALSGPCRLDNGVLLRHLESDSDFEQCVELQKATWGDDFNELVHPTILRISQKVAGVAAGAFDDRGEMLGFVYGLNGYRDKEAAHWSHMLAVKDRARGLGLGKHLKVFQRDFLVSLGVKSMYWTYDPLVARNANLNLNRLGALPVEYTRNMYGSDTGSELHSGLGTDRFIVRWPLESPRVTELLEWMDGSSAPACRIPAFTEMRLLNATQAGEPTGECDDGFLQESGELDAWVEVPADIDKLKAEDMEEALRWRDGARASFEAALSNGFSVTALSYSELKQSRRYFYRLERTR